MGPTIRGPRRGVERFDGFWAVAPANGTRRCDADHPVDPPRTPEEGYHLADDLMDMAIGPPRATIRRAEQAFSVLHPRNLSLTVSRAQVWIDNYSGKFGHGWNS